VSLAQPEQRCLAMSQRGTAPPHESLVVQEVWAVGMVVGPLFAACVPAPPLLCMPPVRPAAAVRPALPLPVVPLLWLPPVPDTLAALPPVPAAVPPPDPKAAFEAWSRLLLLLQAEPHTSKLPAISMRL
jgi:hypothetical protein